MKNDKFVTIKGRKYDIATGLPLPNNSVAPVHSVAPKNASTYLNAAKQPLRQGMALARKVGHTMDVARSKSISHFISRPAAPPKKQGTPDIGPTKHPILARIEKARVSGKPIVKKPEPAATIKNEAIPAGLKRLDDKPANVDSPIKKQHKILNITTAVISLMVIVGYLIYLYLPSFSVRIASTQAGINATYPEYRPDGYSIDGPVAYKDGEVTINFHSNTGDSKFVIKQSKSSLDSSAVKLIAEKASKGEISTTSERGLTIFSYENNAMWVNGGILYAITGDAPLSSDQIRRIAVSL